MSDSSHNLTLGWKITIILTLLIALTNLGANRGVSTLRKELDKDFSNHEKRIDELENAVIGNDIGTAPRENSHKERIKALEERLSSIDDPQPVR